MGLLSKLRGSKGRAQKLDFQSEEVARKREASTRAKAAKDVRRAKAAARMKAAKLKERAKKDARRAGARARSELEEGRTAGNVEAPETSREIFRLAGDSAQLRSPVDATLDPSPDGPMVEGMASTLSLSSPASDSSGDESETTGMLSASFITGESEPFHDSDGSGDGDDVDENPLEFSDDFGVEGGRI
jgi:hypothetical protein